MVQRIDEENIEFLAGAELLKVDLEDEFRELSFQQYWEKVGEQKEGEWSKYEVLPRFAQGLWSQLNS